MSYKIGYVINMEVEGEYTAVAQWCNETQFATIEERDGQYVVIKIPEPTAEEINAARISTIDSRLNELDSKSIRPSRALQVGEGTPEDTAILAQIEAEVAALRSERAILTQ